MGDRRGERDDGAIVALVAGSNLPRRVETS